jgi:hypothetical protein
MDIDQCVDVWRILNRRVSEIGSLGLQKFAIAPAVGFVASPSLMLLVMVIIVPVVAKVQEQKKKKK